MPATLYLFSDYLCRVIRNHMLLHPEYQQCVHAR